MVLHPVYMGYNPIYGFVAPSKLLIPFKPFFGPQDPSTSRFSPLPLFFLETSGAEEFPGKKSFWPTRELMKVWGTLELSEKNPQKTGENA